MPAMSASHLKHLVLNTSTCWFCKALIVKGQKWTVHHKNGNHHDDRKRNLAAVHHGCHTKIHKPWLVMSEDGRRRLREAALKNRPWEYENPGHTGYAHTEEAKAKMSESKMGQHKGWSWRINKNGRREWVSP